MANRRMFSLSVVDTDKFLEMPISSRLLYYELGMRADDDGFVGNWKKILLFTGLKEDDLKLLIAKQFILPFESGVIVIKYWRLNNCIQKDRYKPTIYQEEFSKLYLDNNNVYNMDTEWKHRLGKDRLGKDSIGEVVEDTTAPITLTELIEYGVSIGLNEEYCEKFYNTYDSKGWLNKNNQKITNAKSLLKKWANEDKKKETEKKEKKEEIHYDEAGNKIINGERWL